jgi:hypothetical protein
MTGDRGIGGAEIFRCRHSVYCPDSDWQFQAREGVPERYRISWSCFCCRDYLCGCYSPETILRVVAANQLAVATGGWPRVGLGIDQADIPISRCRRRTWNQEREPIEEDELADELAA